MKSKQGKFAGRNVEDGRHLEILGDRVHIVKLLSVNNKYNIFYLCQLGKSILSHSVNNDLENLRSDGENGRHE